MSQIQYTVSSLEKVFPYKKPTLIQNEYTTFKNETFHFQVVCYTEWNCQHCQYEIDSDIKDKISVRKVELVPANFAVNTGKTDDYVLLKKPNGIMFPDLLRPVYDLGDYLRMGNWSAFWVTVDASEDLPVGVHDISIRIYTKDGNYDKTSKFTLTVLDESLPELDIHYTGWMHYDCICDKHNVEPFTPEFYNIFEKYLESAVKHGMNMLYTPIFTPSLDTAIDTYRRTVQLVKVILNGDKYSFDFSDLSYFVDFVLSRGIKYIELAHLATQWGAKCTPKIMADVDGKEERIFGWDEASTSERYETFLNAFLSELSKFVKEKGIEDIIHFHISDEPALEALERFSHIKKIIVKYFPNAKSMDALTEKEFSDDGLINHPVVATSHYDTFPTDWVYYCCVQTNEYLSNRLFNMPSQRTRILGMQMYRNSSTGFLHWGFNFYHSVASVLKVDPYFITDGAGGFQSGDSFLVYPTENGVYESLRHEVFFDGFNDYRALKLLEQKIGKDKVIKLLDDEGVKEGYKTYKRSAKWHIAFRKKLNKLIMQSK